MCISTFSFIKYHEVPQFCKVSQKILYKDKYYGIIMKFKFMHICKENVAKTSLLMLAVWLERERGRERWPWSVARVTLFVWGRQPRHDGADHRDFYDGETTDYRN